MSNQAEDFLMGGGGASAKFNNVGDTITGEVVTFEVRQQTDIGDGKPLVWDDGSPRMQMVVTLQTDIRDDDVDDDDGQRNLYVKGSKKPGSKSLHDAVAQAVRNARAKGLEPGGKLTVSYVGEEPSGTRGFNPRKLYDATYQAPDKTAHSGGFLGTDSTGQQAPAATPASPPAPMPQATPLAPPAAASPVPAADPVARARELITIGGNDAAIAAETKLSPAVVAALRNSMPKPAADPQAEATARQLIDLGMDDKEIADSTGLTADQVQGLRNQAA